MRVLVVEDAWRLAEAVAEILRGEGWSADVATDGGRGAELAAAGVYDCVLLDVMLPVMGGLDVLCGMREAGDATPVILVTARDAVPDRVAGLDAGADDYLVKPFHAEELLARVRAVCRRPRAIEEAGPLRALGLELDEDSLEVRAAGGAAVSLRARECQLLAELMTRPGRVVAKRDLIDRVWGPGTAGGGNRLEVLVHDLRLRLAEAGAAAEVATVRGAGYALREASAGGAR